MDKNYFVWPIRVYYEDTDCAGIVYYANYLKFFERARTEALRTLNVDQHDIMRGGPNIVFVVVGVDIKYSKPARLDEQLEVRTKIDELRKASMVFVQEIWRGDELLVAARTRCASLDSQTRRPKMMPQSFLEGFKKYM